MAVQREDGDEVEYAQDDADQHDSAQVETQVVNGVKPVKEEAIEHSEVQRRAPRHQAQLEGKAGDEGDDEVRERAGAGDDSHRRLGVAGDVGVDRHRFAPAEPDQEQQDRARRVQMGQGVEGHAAAAAGQAVAHAIGHVGVGELVEGDANDQGCDEGSEEN